MANSGCAFGSKKVLFIHIPKTAGTTFKRILFSRFDDEEICPIWDEQILRQNLEYNLSKYRLFHGHFNYELVKSFQEKPILITFLRNPVARVRSHYYYERSLSDEQVRGLSPEAQYVAKRAKEVALSEYLETESLFLERMTANIQTRKIANSTDYPLHAFSDEELIAAAVNNLSAFDFVGIVEQFERSLRLFFEQFQLGPVGSYESANITPGERRVGLEEATEMDGMKRKLGLDMQLYTFGLQLFEDRLKNYGIE